jgi:hypothetical protein
MMVAKEYPFPTKETYVQPPRFAAPPTRTGVFAFSSPLVPALTHAARTIYARCTMPAMPIVWRPVS